MKIGLKSCSKCCTFFQNSVPLIFLFLPANFILPSICTMTRGGKSFSTILPHQLTYTQLRHWQCWLMWNFVLDDCWGSQDCLGITRRMLFDPSKLLLVFIHKSFALSPPPSLFQSHYNHNSLPLCNSVSGMDLTRARLRLVSSVEALCRRACPPLPIRSSSNSTATSAPVASLCCIITVTAPLITAK